MNVLYEQLQQEHLKGRETNFFRKPSTNNQLIDDDFGMVRLKGQMQHDFE